MFTKGPWKIGAHCSTAVFDVTGRSIASAGGYQSNIKPDQVFTENEANAHLIAAAPDLYEALKHLVEYIDKEGPAAKEWKAITEWCEKGEQAILKAEGKS